MARDSCVLSLPYLTGSASALERKMWHLQRSWATYFATVSLLWGGFVSCSPTSVSSCSIFSLTALLRRQGEKRTHWHLWRHRHYLGLKSSGELTQFFLLAITPTIFQIKDKTLSGESIPLFLIYYFILLFDEKKRGNVILLVCYPEQYLQISLLIKIFIS